MSAASALASAVAAYLNKRKDSKASREADGTTIEALEALELYVATEPEVASSAAAARSTPTNVEAPPVEKIFADARRRISLGFRIRLGIAIALVSVLIVGIAGCVVAGLLGEAIWASAFGGIATLDLITFAFSKPLKAITDAVAETQRLEIAHLRLVSELKSCQAYTDTTRRIECEAKAWASVEASLTSISAEQPAS